MTRARVIEVTGKDPGPLKATFTCDWCHKTYSDEEYGRGFFQDFVGEKAYEVKRVHSQICMYCEETIDGFNDPPVEDGGDE